MARMRSAAKGILFAMGMQKTAPPGYPSNDAARKALDRYGWVLFGGVRMAVLCFHAERTTGWGWESDQHSQSQAMTGVRTKTRVLSTGEVVKAQWVRGPCGVAQSTYHKVNNELLIDKDHPQQTVDYKTVRYWDNTTCRVPKTP